MTDSERAKFVDEMKENFFAWRAAKRAGASDVAIIDLKKKALATLLKYGLTPDDLDDEQYGLKMACIRDPRFYGVDG